MTEHPPLVSIVGPTAVGKTELSIEVANRLKGEIVSADSRLFYRGMDIGTAKPTNEQLSRVPHHLINVSDPDERWSLARFRRAAMEAIESIHQKSRLPIVVGGTGQYQKALLEGWRPPPRPPDDSIRKQYRSMAREHGPAELHERLKQVDPRRAEEIDPRNVRRVIRALEIYEFTGKPPSEFLARVPPPFRIQVVGLTLPRDHLYQRIDRRIERMFQAGFIQEVQSLLDQGYDPNLPAMSAIGYRQVIDYLQGKITLEEAKGEIKRLTRKFVRRQANWFKLEDPEIRWFQKAPGVAEEVVQFLKGWLKDLIY